MSEHTQELRTFLDEVGARWLRLARLRGLALGAATSAMLLAVGALAAWLLALDGLPLVAVVVFVAALAATPIPFALWPTRATPSPLRLARLVEEKVGGLDDVVVTAIEPPPQATPAIVEILSSDAVRAIRAITIDRVVDADTLRRAVATATAACAALAIGAAVFAPAAERATDVVGAYLLPFRLTFDVSPGSTKVRAGEPVTITAHVTGLGDGMTPALVRDDGPAIRMRRGQSPGEFSVTLPNVDASFDYAVTVGRAASDRYTIRAVRPVTIERIDLTFEYPRELGLPNRTEEDSGDIYAPTGTRVRVSVVADKPIVRGHLAIAGGAAVPLDGADRVQSASLTIEKDGAYRVALTDEDGFESPGDTEYFIRMLEDAPPNVRILRPGGDKQVTPVEEVLIEASAEDDHGLAAFDLVFQTAAGAQTVVPLPSGGALTATGRHEIFLEDLRVAPGDFVTYYARARDVARGRQAAEARSDIYFLEVKPFEEEFSVAQSQAASQAGGSPELQELAEAQKEIIAATWKLDARARRGGDARSQTDIRAIGEAQIELKGRAEVAAAQSSMLNDPRRRRAMRPGLAPGGDDPMARAVEAMGRAAGELDRLRTAGALPHELEALNQLLKADSDIKRRQVQRQQQAGGGGNGNRNAPDLSTLFDQQLRKRQETNYETPPSASDDAQEADKKDPLERIRELAKRQERLGQDQQDLARNRQNLSEEEMRRQLERLTREQNELRQQAEDLSKQLRSAQSQQQGQQGRQGRQGQPSQAQSASPGPGQSSGGSQASANSRGRDGQSASDSQRMQMVAEQMQSASSDLRRQDPAQASARASRALEALRDLQRDLESARPDERRRALGDLQLETRQLADAERRLSTETARTPAGDSGADARRRLAAEQDRLADRADRLRASVDRMNERSDAGGESSADDADARRAMTEASSELGRQRIAERMRESADAIRQDRGAPESRGRQSEELARALDRIAERLGAAGNVADAEAQRLSEQLAKTDELRQRVNGLQRSLEALDREARQTPAEASSGQGISSTDPRSAASQPGSANRESSGDPGDAAGGRAGRVERLQREAENQLREAQRLSRELGDQNAEADRGRQTPDEWWPSLSAPGTEAFKQDFAKWESLKKQLLAAVEQVETSVSARLRERENRQRLNAGRHEGVTESYRDLVDKYYESLATPRKRPQ